MGSFFADLAHNPLLVSSLIGGLLASIACGTVGPLVVGRRIVFLAGAIAHIALGGIGCAIALRYHLGWEWLEPLHGATLAAVLAAIILAVVHHYVQTGLDSLIGALWSVGMAIGIVLIKITPGYHVELMSYLFGNLAVVGWDDVWLLASLNVAVIGLLALGYKRIVAVGLDSEQARLQGISVLGTNILLLILVALTVVALTRIVGLILVIALLALPAATLAPSMRHLGRLMLACCGLSALLVTLPRIAVYGSPIAAEAAIILSAGGVYLMVMLARVLRRPRRVAGNPQATLRFRQR